MKRFVTYLYECERGNKKKNVGFIRVNVREGETTMEVYIRNLSRGIDIGKLYALVYKEELLGIELGEVEIKNGQSDCRIIVETEEIKGSGFSLDDICGIGIRLDGGVYIASCWKDEHVEEITGGVFSLEEEKEKSVVLESMMYPRVELAQDLEPISECSVIEDTPTYEKIDLSQIRDLPSPNWHFATNSFLVHGFWNYGYLVLKKAVEEEEETMALGVPGIFEKPEAVMAVLFGFPNFETIPQEAVVEQKEKNQETEEGTFGCWFVRLKM